jgi:hypothetical protein
MASSPTSASIVIPPKRLCTRSIAVQVAPLKYRAPPCVNITQVTTKKGGPTRSTRTLRTEDIGRRQIHVRDFLLMESDLVTACSVSLRGHHTIASCATA